MIKATLFTVVMLATGATLEPNAVYCTGYAVTVPADVHAGLSLDPEPTSGVWRIDAFRECSQQGAWQ